MPDFRRGREAIEEAANRRGGSGNFRSFVPNITWREDAEKKYILVLTPIDEVPTINLHEWIPVGKGEKANGESYTMYEQFISRKDPGIGEDFDLIEDEFDRSPKERNIGVAVELEPVMVTERGRKRPKGFVVKTDTYTRKGEDGEEEVTQPVIGLICQSGYLVWSPLGSLDESVGPLTECPVEVTRRGTNANTRYDFVPFSGQEVDLSPVKEYLDGISYLSDDLEDVIAAIEAADDEIGQAQAVADALLSKRLEELADPERYEELMADVTEIPDKFGKSKNKGKKKSGSGATARKSRPARRSAREAAQEPPETEADDAPPESNGDDGDTSTEESVKSRFNALKARVEAG